MAVSTVPGRQAWVREFGFPKPSSSTQAVVESRDRQTPGTQWPTSLTEPWAPSSACTHTDTYTMSHCNNSSRPGCYLYREYQEFSKTDVENESIRDPGKHQLPWKGTENHSKPQALSEQKSMSLPPSSHIVVCMNRRVPEVPHLTSRLRVTSSQEVLPLALRSCLSTLFPPSVKCLFL